MKLLSKDDILKADDLKSEIVDVPEWGGSVKIRTMTGRERDAFEEWMFKNKGKDKSLNMKNLRARLVSLTVVDEDGGRIFMDADIDALGNKSASALDRIFTKAQKLNGIGANDVEELTKNCEGDQSEDSASGSPSS